MAARWSKGIMKGFFYVPKEELADLEGTRRALTFMPKGKSRGVEVYHETEAWFGFPRYWFKDASRLVRDFVDLRSDGQPVVFFMKSGLRDYQLLTFRELIFAKSEGRTGFVIEADPAFGKTVVMLSWIQVVARTALVIVPSRGLISQWKDRIIEHTTLGEEEIGVVNGRRLDWRGKKIVIALVHSLPLENNVGSEFRDYFGHVLWDEVHTTLPPQTFAPSGGQFPARFRTSASATLDRFDGMEKVFEKHLQEIKVHGEDPNQVKPLVRFILLEGSCGHIPEWCKTNEQRRGVLIKKLALDETRNHGVSSEILEAYQQGYRIVVLSDRVKQLLILQEMLIGQRVPRGDTGVYVGSIDGRVISEAVLDRVKSKARVILATYGMFKLGQDVDSLDCLVYATPQSDPRQSSGRIRRKKEGKRRPVIKDFIDMAYKETRGWAKKRLRFYKAAGFDIGRG